MDTQKAKEIGTHVFYNFLLKRSEEARKHPEKLGTLEDLSRFL
jgi:hypothetical protein